MEKLNKFAPQHSRLFKEVEYPDHCPSMLTHLLQMIIVALPSKPFTYTVKGTPRREAVINGYSAEISSLYQAVGKTAQEQISPPRSWRYEDNLPFTRVVVQNVMGKSLADEENIFEAGGDRWGVSYILSCSFWLNSLLACRRCGYETRYAMHLRHLQT